MKPTAAHLLGEGKAALDRGDWEQARSLLANALALEETAETAETAETLYLLARAAEWSADYRDAIELYERAFVAYRELGETRMPALIAGRELSFLHIAVYGNEAVSGGWLARARRLAEEAGVCVEAGWVELACALMTDDPGAKERHVGTAADIARRFGDADLHFGALAHEGTTLVLAGRITAGMLLVDEAATAAASGEVKDYLTAGEIYCHMLLCCELTLDVRRAQQWMAVGDAFGTRSNAPWVPAICRTHYGGILTSAGRWNDAERQLATSITLYEASYPALRSSAMVRLADLRVRQGRYAEAARLLAGFEFDSFAVRPMARLHLARGEYAVARRLLRRWLGGGSAHPLQAPELALLVEVEVMAGRIDEARLVYARLSTVAAENELPRIRALAQYSAGIIAAAAGDPDALAHFEAALPGFAAAELPLEEARVRLAISRLLAQSAPEIAVPGARSALAVFDGLAAGADADAAASQLRGLGEPGRARPRVPGALTRRESEVLVHIAEGLTNEQIARRLYLSKRTVEHHVSSILRKLGLANRAEATAYSLRGPAEHGAAADFRSGGMLAHEPPRKERHG
ncbi:helix-turn-helix transcriptional regulator [Amycolatopsis palatopharyngis]|uniref:helix-turn-helix transcriptional regulator n=1 Tax=Amycolatopsis palatopharyngis TaxID=187982 RepID=UPI0013BE93CE|nr:helix-turn-helix transcriptional regulator [Amycolatopsis palatopharyngis]